jgi:ribonuclease P protein component
MNRRHRLTSSTDFKRVRRTGKSYAHPLAILVASPNSLTTSRFGITASRGMGSAVRRNRGKRLLREAVRCHISHTASGWDVILIARSAILEADWPEVRNSVAGLLRQANLLKNHDG